MVSNGCGHVLSILQIDGQNGNGLDLEYSNEFPVMVLKII